MSLTLVATFNTKDEANRAVDALVDAGWDRRSVSTTVRREIGMRSGSVSPLSSFESDAFKAVMLVAFIGSMIGAAIGLMLSIGTLGLQFEPFSQNPIAGLIAGAIAGLAIGTYSGAVASVGKSRDQHLHHLSPYLSAKERVMVSLTVPDEVQEATSKLLRHHGAHAVREWSLIVNDLPTRGIRI